MLICKENIMSIIIICLASLFFLGHALNWFFVKTKIPDLLILVFLGYIVGPVLGFVDASDLGQVGQVMSTVALVVILYEGGLNLNTRDLMTSTLPAMGLTLLGFSSIVGLATVVSHFIGGLDWGMAILLGVGIGSTSSAIVIPMVKQLSISDNVKTVLGLESAFTDVLTIVIFLVLVDSLSSGIFDYNDLLVGIGPKTLLAGLMGLGFAIIWAILKKQYSNIFSMTFSGEAWALLTYGVLEFSGFNGAIGVLTLGFFLANLHLFPNWLKSIMSAIPVTYKDLSLLKEATFLLRTFFFLYLGLLVKFSNIKIVMIAIVLSLLIFVTRFLTIKTIFRGDKYSGLDKMVAVAMGPRGLACAVLATIPYNKGIAGGEFLRDCLFAIIPITILLTAIFVAVSEQGKAQEKFQHKF